MSARPAPQSHFRPHASASQSPCFWPGSQESEAVEALRRSCYGAGHTSQELGSMLVEMGLYGSRRSSADAHVRACTNPGRTEYFSPSELIAVQVFTGCHDWLLFEARALGRAEPVLADPQELLRQARDEAERHRVLAAQAQARVADLEAQVGQNERRAPKWNPPVGAKFQRTAQRVEAQHIARSGGRDLSCKDLTAPVTP